MALPYPVPEVIHLSTLSRLAFSHPKLVIAALLAITVVFALFLPKMEFDADLERMVPADDPAIKDIRDATAEFGYQDVFLVVLRGEDVFTANTLAKIYSLAEEIREIQGVEAVLDPITVDLIRSSELGIEIVPAAPGLPQTDDEIDEFRRSITDSQYLGKLISEDGRAAAIMVTMENAGELANARSSQIARDVEGLAQKYRGPEEILIVGNAYISYYAEQTIKEDMSFLIPLVIAVLLAILYWSFRTTVGVALPLLTVVTSVIWAVGLMSMLRIPLTIVTMVTPVILLAIGSAYGMHILNKYTEALAAGNEKGAALEETMGQMNAPVAMTSLTTVAGFASLVSSFVTPIRQFGVFTAFGVLAAMIFSMLFIPAVLVLRPAPSQFTRREARPTKRIVDALSALGGFVAAHARGVTIASIIIVVVCVVGALNLSLESNMMNYFEKGSPIIRGTNIVEDQFGGSMQVSLVFDTGEPDGVKEPAVLNRMLETQDFLNSVPGVSRATSIADVVRELNRALNMGENEYYTIPETRQAVAQELLLFTLQGGSSVDSLVSYNFDKAIVSARIESMSSEQLRRTIRRLDDYVRANYPSDGDLQVKVVGIPNVMLVLADRFRDSQIYSLAISIVTCGIIVSILMGSFLAGVISILPLILTVAVNFGVMGYSGVPLDAVTTMIASIAVGIGIDYSIHYISRYRLEIEAGKDPSEAIATTSSTAGRGIFFNALTLIVGFAILAFSHFRAVDVFGYLIALTMLTSSLSSLTIVPAILRLLRPTALMGRTYRLSEKGGLSK
ncbi:MAG: RND family transporter [Firmicutes bacterium]|nr:RND family transporter [Bacillota bacterium]